MGNLCEGGGKADPLNKDDCLVGLIQSEGTFGEAYTLGKQLGVGQYGTAFVAECKKTGRRFAVKAIAKEKLKSQLHLDDVRREVEIMRHLKGAKHIVSLEDVYEDSTTIYMVMELCTGGELFDSISAAGHFTERKAAAVFRVILEVVAFCHAKGVIHRDLKPENFLLSDKTDKAVVKAIDFGQSTFFTKGQTFDDPMGSAYYVAPEMLAGKYSNEADWWACGVILYILLSGVPPFYAEDPKQIFEMVKVGELDFSDEPWPRVSEGAKTLVRRLCEMDVRKRLTAEAALKDPWIVKNTHHGHSDTSKTSSADQLTGVSAVASSATGHQAPPPKTTEKDQHGRNTHHHHGGGGHGGQNHHHTAAEAAAPVETRI